MSILRKMAAVGLVTTLAACGSGSPDTPAMGSTPETTATLSASPSPEPTASPTSEPTASASPTPVNASAPAAPTLDTVLQPTNADSVEIAIKGAAGTDIFVDGVASGQMSTAGHRTLTLITAGDDGVKTFSITLKNSAGLASAALSVTLIKDATPPATNASVDPLKTDDPTPALSGKLPSGASDAQTSAYRVAIIVNEQRYAALNQGDGSWSVADNRLTALDEGFFDVTVISTDEAGNTSQTLLKNPLEINYSAFLIDSALEGIAYQAGRHRGYTDQNGMFKYEKGAEAVFYLGSAASGIPLGRAQVKTDPHNTQRHIITLFDLGGSQDAATPGVLNRGRLLQSLDSDNDTSNGIEIDQRTRAAIDLLGLKNRLDFNANTADFAAHNDIYTLFNDLAGHFGEHRGLVAASVAQAHLEAVRDNIALTRATANSVLRGAPKEAVVLTGRFNSLDGPVEGLEYRSGNQYGRTNAAGEFHYEEGKQLKLFIYQLELGVTRAKALVTPADLVPATSFNHPKPRNISRLLRAFDAVSDDGKITIDQAVRDALETFRSQIDLNLPDGKPNAELGTGQGPDEFGAQFDDFELGKDILETITALRMETE